MSMSNCGSWMKYCWLCLLCLRDRVVFAHVAFLHDYDRQSDHRGRSAADAGSGGAVPWLADPADRHHRPVCAHAAICLVRHSIKRINTLQYKFMPHTTKRAMCQLHDCNAWEQNPNEPSRCCVFRVRMFPESLRWLLVTQHYQRAKRQMYRIAHSNSVDTATDPSGILSGEQSCCCWCECALPSAWGWWWWWWWFCRAGEWTAAEAEDVLRDAADRHQKPVEEHRRPVCQLVSDALQTFKTLYIDRVLDFTVTLLFLSVLFGRQVDL